MRIISVHLENVRCHNVLDLDFRPGLVTLLGPNGAGKSSILQGIAWGLFDYLPIKKVDFVRHGEDKATVRVVFHQDGKMWVVERTTAGRYILADEKRPVANGRNDVVAYLKGIFNLGEIKLPALYKDAIGVPQGMLTAGFDLSSVARQNFWGPVLHLDAYRRVFDALRNPAKLLDLRCVGATRLVQSIQRGLDNILGQLSLSQEELDESRQTTTCRLAALPELIRRAQELSETCEQEYQVAAAEVQTHEMNRARLIVCEGRLAEVIALMTDLPPLSNLRAEIMSLRARAVFDSDELSSLRKELQRTSQKRSGVEVALAQCTSETTVVQGLVEQMERLYDDLPGQQAQLADLKIQGVGLERRCSELAQQIGSLFEKRESAKGALSLLVLGEPCPTCGTLLTDESIGACRDRLMVQIREALVLPQLQVQYDLAQGEQGRVIAQIGRLEGAIAQVPEKSEAEAVKERSAELLSKLTAGRYELVALVQTEEATKVTLITQEALFREAEQAKERMAEKQQQLASVQATSTALTDEQQRLEDEMATLLPQVKGSDPDLQALKGRSIQALQEYHRLAIEATKLQATLGLLSGAVLERDALVEAKVKLQRDEKLTGVLKQCRSAIAASGPAVAEQVMRHLSVLADRYWQMMSHDEQLSWAGDFALSVANQGFHQLSGGEKVAAALAARMAVAQWMSNLDFLILDEPTVHLDTAARAGLVETLGLLNLEQVIVVSHDQTFSSLAGQVIRLGGVL